MAGAGRSTLSRNTLTAFASTLSIFLLILAPASHSALPPAGTLVATSTSSFPLAPSPTRSTATLTDDASVALYQSGVGINLAMINHSGAPVFLPAQISTSTETAAIALGPPDSVLVGSNETSGLQVAKFALPPATPLSALTLDAVGTRPSLASSPGEYAATWLHAVSGSAEIRFATSPDGATWSPAQSVVATSANARAAVAYASTGAVVMVADGGQLTLYRKSGAGFASPQSVATLSGSSFSLVDVPLAAAYESPQGVWVATESGAGFATEKVASNQESQPSLGSTSSGLVLVTASSGGVIRRHLQNGAWSSPIVEIASPGAFSPQISQVSGPNRNGASWARQIVGGSEVSAAALDVAPPIGTWLNPEEHSIIAGTIPLRIEITDDVGVATQPDYFIAPESLPPGELGTNIEDIHGPPPWVPGPPPTVPPPGAGGGGAGGNPPPASQNPQPPPPAISPANQGVIYEQAFDTRQVPDGEYRFTATAQDTSLNQMRVVLDPIIDNKPPEVGIDLPVTDALVTASALVTGTVTDRNLGRWDLWALVPGRPQVLISSGTTPVPSGSLGTYLTTMAPANYAGPVDLVLAATDLATPAPNTSTYTRRIQSDDSRDAFGFLRNSPTYEISATVPITADISGLVANWTLEAFRVGETTPGITPPSYANSGAASGNGVSVGSWEVANTWGPGEVIFRLTTTDITGADTFVDQKTSSFVWRPLELAITSPFLDGALSGTIEVNGFISGSNVWAWAIGMPISDTNPAFSPDGRRVAFESSRENLFGKDIWIVNTDGSRLTRLTGQPDVSTGFNGSPSFSPDGSQIVFFSTRDGNSEIYVMNDDGTSLTNLTNHPAADSFPTFSPDGTKIAFVSDRSGRDAIWMMNADGTNQTLVADVAGQAQMPDFSPDGKRIVFDAGTRGIQQIYFVYLTDTANPVQLTTEWLFSANPDFSPDGNRIAFTSARIAGENPHIFMMNADGTSATQYTSTPTGEDDSAFSPDFGLLAFASARSGSLEIYLMTDTPFATAVPLTSQSSIFGIHDRLPEFSPLRYPFPPAPTANMVTKIDVAAFVEGSYQFPVPNQFPTGERPTDGLLGHIDTTKLKPGINSIELVALQCPTEPPPFIFRVPRQFEQETSDTITALGGCTASSFRQTIRVEVSSAHVEVTFSDNVAGAGYAGPLAVTDTFYARGSWNSPDNWALGPSLVNLQRGPSPELVRTAGRMWANGPPASDGNSYVPVGDPAALENIKAIMNDPAAGLEVLAGVPPTEYPSEQFAAGRVGPRYEVALPPSPEHFGGTLRVIAWKDAELGVLGAIQYSYTDTWSGPETNLPGLGQAWGPRKGTAETVGTRIVFSAYNRDNPVPPVPEAAT